MSEENTSQKERFLQEVEQKLPVQELLFYLSQKSFLLRCEFFAHAIPPICSALFERKKGAGHWFVKTNNPASIIL